MKPSKILEGRAYYDRQINEHASESPVPGYSAVLLYFSSCCNRPDGFELAIAIGIVVVVQVDGCIDMAGDKLYAIAHFQLDVGRFRAFIPC